MIRTDLVSVCQQQEVHEGGKWPLNSPLSIPNFNLYSGKFRLSP
jgi:hypothetical protein